MRINRIYNVVKGQIKVFDCINHAFQDLEAQIGQKASYQVQPITKFDGEIIGTAHLTGFDGVYITWKDV